MMAGSPSPIGVTLAPSALGGRTALEIEPEDGAIGGTFLYFHGGSWMFGSPATAQHIIAALVRRTGAQAVTLDYRLAPEHPFPAAIDDGVAAYRDLLEQDVPAERIMPTGDSAGGGLSVMTAPPLRVASSPGERDHPGRPRQADVTRGESTTAKDGIDPLFTRQSPARLDAHYLAGQNARQPLLSPAVHSDLTGLPPPLLQAGSNGGAARRLGPTGDPRGRSRCRRDPRRHRRRATRLPVVHRLARRGGRGTGAGRSLHTRPAGDRPGRALTAALSDTEWVGSANSPGWPTRAVGGRRRRAS
ncbi:alpha/beta hydrolase fold domain-containing protein [Streptomyces mirabilis]